MTSSKEDKVSDMIADDLAYVRALAEAGRNAPLVGGRYYLIWGGLIGLAAFIAYFNASGVLSLGAMGGYVPWVLAGVLGWVLSFTVGRRAGVKPGALTLGNRTAMAAWFGVGIFMTVLFATFAVAHDNFIDDGIPAYFLFDLMFPIAFGLYGVAFYATATAAQLNWLKYFSGLSWAFAVICIFLIGSDLHLLAGAIGTVLCAALPGLLLMRAEPKDIV